MFDICIIGHITRDRIETAHEKPRVQPGGTVYYAGSTAASLGLRTAVITKANPVDHAFLVEELAKSGVATSWVPSTETTEFINIYPGPDYDTRIQQVVAVADPFNPEEFGVDAHVYLLGPLTRSEISLDCVRALAATGRRIALDVQGLIRQVRGLNVVRMPFVPLASLLSCVHVLKASADEALYITGADSVEAAAELLFASGPSEVLITSGSKGSLVFDGHLFHAIPAYPPTKTVDCTGCGDTYLAAYLAYRFSSDDVIASGHFAANVATAKISGHGAFRGTWADGTGARHLPAIVSENGENVPQAPPTAVGINARHV